MMKKTVSLMVMATMLLSACQTVQKSATTADISTQVRGSVTVADLKVGDRITYTMTPSKDVCRGGESNVKNVAQAEALTKLGGNADLLIEPQYTLTKKRGFFGSKITSITVSGRPAFYTNFRALPDSLMFKPVYAKSHVAKPKGTLFGRKLKSSEPQAVTGPKLKAMRKKGFDFHLELMAGYYNHENIGDGDAVAGATVNLDYNINSHLTIGPGIGFNYGTFNGTWSLPLYANVRYSFSPTLKSWFVEGRLGGNIICAQEDHYYRAEESSSSGVYLGLALGYSWKHFELALRYNFVGSNITTVDEWYNGHYYEYRESTVSNNKDQGVISFGIRF